jgi:hypothetical protein
MARQPPPRRARRPPSRVRAAIHHARRTLGKRLRPIALPALDEEGLVLEPPIPPLWKDKGESEFRVPTVALAADALMADGRRFRGRIFLPTAAHDHAGNLRPEEWMNDGVEFFPFLPDEPGGPVFLNKREVVVVTVAASSDRDTTLEAVAPPARRLTLECGSRRFSGSIVIDMPENHSRVLDYLNRPGAFLTLRDGDRHHLVAKARITRVIESRED